MDENIINECKEMIDTPERGKKNQMATSINKSEDSPVFSFLNSLSPMKPVKSAPFTQTINPLTFASCPSVFSSPQAKSPKECRFNIQRNQRSDRSKPEFFSNEGNKNKSNFDPDKVSDDHKENLDPISSSDGGVANFELSCSNLIVEFAENVKYRQPKVTLSDSPVNLEGITQITEQNKEEGMSSCDWEDLISNASDLLMFGSPHDTKTGPPKTSADPALSFYTSIKHALQNTLSRDEEIMNPGENVDYYQLPGLYRGVRRRCLVYDMAGTGSLTHLEPWADDPSPGPSVQRQPDENIMSNQQITFKNAVNHNPSSQHTLSGTGLHLNALASTSNDYLNDVVASRRFLIGPSSYTSFHPPCDQEIGIDNVENGVVRMEDCGFKESEEINLSSPKKKRRRLDRGLEGEGACKRCHCKKSKCLKLYCECFAAGVYCVEPCACLHCFNKPIHEDTVLATRKQIESRNPLAFAPKVIRGSDSVSEIGDDCSKTPASGRHKRGCNCKKSGCLKKYCECYQSGVGCSINCRCEGCKNAFGRKDGSGASNISHEYEEDETNTIEKAELNRSFRKATIHDHFEQDMNSDLSAMPLSGGRQLAGLFSTKKRSYISSVPSISSSPFSTSQSFGKSTSFLPLPPKFNHSSQTLKEDEMPDFLLEASPKSSIKSLSPNGRRVSPPQRVERSPGLRSSRKLILQSIPTFPSLANNQ